MQIQGVRSFKHKFFVMEVQRLRSIEKWPAQGFCVCLGEGGALALMFSSLVPEKGCCH